MLDLKEHWYGPQQRLHTQTAHARLFDPCSPDALAIQRYGCESSMLSPLDDSCRRPLCSHAAYMCICLRVCHAAFSCSLRLLQVHLLVPCICTCPLTGLTAARGTRVPAAALACCPAALAATMLHCTGPRVPLFCVPWSLPSSLCRCCRCLSPDGVHGFQVYAAQKSLQASARGETWLVAGELRAACALQLPHVGSRSTPTCSCWPAAFA